MSIQDVACFLIGLRAGYLALVMATDTTYIILIDYTEGL